MKYRRKPIVVEAVRYNGRNGVEVEAWLRSHGVKPGWSNDALTAPTLAFPGDYVIKGAAGEFHSCKPKVFEATYEEVLGEDEQQAVDEDALDDWVKSTTNRFTDYYDIRAQEAWLAALAWVRAGEN